MGHQIGGGFLKATTKEAAMREGLADAEEYAYYNADRQENFDASYDNDFRYYDKTFENEEDAEHFFESLGSYCDGVCKVKQASKSAQTKYSKTITKIREKQRELRDKAIEAFKERTSASVGCKKCGTRIPSNIAIQRKLICPNCGDWLASNSYKQRFLKLEEAMELAEKQLAKDTAETGTVRFWARYSVHS